MAVYDAVQQTSESVPKVITSFRRTKGWRNSLHASAIFHRKPLPPLPARKKFRREFSYSREFQPSPISPRGLADIWRPLDPTGPPSAARSSSIPGIWPGPREKVEPRYPGSKDLEELAREKEHCPASTDPEGKAEERQGRAQDNSGRGYIQPAEVLHKPEPAQRKQVWAQRDSRLRIPLQTR